MPRISKNSFANTTSEVISGSDSESVSDKNSSTEYGTGDEGVEISTGNADSISSAAVSQSNSYGFPAPVQAIVGTFCAATAVAGGIMLIYGGMGNSNFFGDQHDLYRAMFVAGGVMLGTGSLVTMLCVVKPLGPAGQLPVASA